MGSGTERATPPKSMADSTESVAFGGVYDHFMEHKEVLSLIDTLPRVFNDLRSREMSQERLTRT